MGGVAVLLLACVMSGPVMGQLDLSGQGLPGWFFADRLARVDQHLAGKLERASKVEASDVAVAEAQKNLILIARGLLAAGRDGGEQGHLATLYALTLLDGVEDFDKITDALPGQVSEALRGKGDHAQRRVEELTQVVQAIRAFNAAPMLDSQTPAGAGEGARNFSPGVMSAQQLDDYLRRTLGPLSQVAQKLENRRVRSTWAVVEQTGSVSAPYLKQQLKQLEERAKASKIDAGAVENIGKMVALLNDASGYSDMRPRVAVLAKQLEQMLEVSEQLSQLSWLDERARLQISKEIATMATLMMEPGTRGAAVEHIQRMQRLSKPAAMLTALAQIENMPIDNLRRVFGAVLVLQDDAQLASTAEALTEWLGRLTAILMEHHQPGDAKSKKPGATGFDVAGLPMDIRKVLAQLQQQYDAQEKQTLEALPALAADPTQVTQPMWNEPLTRMAIIAQQVRHLRQIPDWAKRMNRINPMAVRGLYKQYLLIAQDLLKPATAEGATNALAEMERQLALFEYMPGEELLSQNDADMNRLLGNQRAALWQQLLVLRSQWAAAWGAGIDPTPTGRKLLLMRRLMSDLITAAKLPEVKKAAEKLNRWAAWEADAAVWEPVQAGLIEQLRTAQQQAAGDKWEELGKTLDRADAATAALGLVADLSVQLDASMDKIGGGFSSTLSQCLYCPGSHALAGEYREELAKLCVYLTAAADAQAHHPDQVKMLNDVIGELAIRLRAQLAASAAAAGAGVTVQ